MNKTERIAMRIVAGDSFDRKKGDELNNGYAQVRKETFDTISDLKGVIVSGNYSNLDSFIKRFENLGKRYASLKSIANKLVWECKNVTDKELLENFRNFYDDLIHLEKYISEPVSNIQKAMESLKSVKNYLNKAVFMK